MELRQLRYVLAVADEGTFTRAAAATHVAQPSLSQAVRSLERELGVELFHRTPRAALLTAAGQALVEPARQALRDVATIRSAVDEVVGIEAGRLDLVCLPTLAAYPVAELIGRFRRAHPGVTVRLAEPEDAAAIDEQVRDGSSEIGFTELPLRRGDLSAHRLAAEEFVALVPPWTRPGRRVSVQALSAQPLITTPRGTSMRRLIDEAFARAGAEVVVAVETDHREAIAPLVLAGAGVAVVPRRVALDAVARGAAIREITPRIGREVGLIHRSGPLSPAARAFVALALEGDDGS